MKRILCVLVIVLVSSCLGHSQLLSKMDVFGGYSYSRVNPTTGNAVNTSGWELSADYRLMPHVALVADASGLYCCNSQSLYTFMAGAQLSQHLIGGTAMVHALAGGAHADANATDTGAAWALGVGWDRKIAPRISWRVVQADYLGTDFLSNTQANYRFTTGLVLKLGKH
jgi:hypothetical protein